MPASVSSSARNGQASPTSIAILGSTGSIGVQTLEVVAAHSERFEVEALTARQNVDRLAEQARAVRPRVVAIADKDKVGRLEELLEGTGIRVLGGAEGLSEVAALEKVGVVVAAIVGFAGLHPVLTALEEGKQVALANKETLVAGGALVERLLQEHSGRIVPVDSEHSAIFQCLAGEPEGAVERLTLTASGGPFRERPAVTFGEITPADALDHPTWSMGRKITIDSATLMNKGLEVIEARWLFGVGADRIDVLIHPQSIIHSMVTFTDGSTKAQLGLPDMRGPIQYALSYPERWRSQHERIDWGLVPCLDFELPDTERFPCLRLAYEALRAGGTAPTVLNAANEAAVGLFLKEKIRFTDIPRAVEHALEQVKVEEAGTFETLQAADHEARCRVQELSSHILI